MVIRTQHENDGAGDYKEEKLKMRSICWDRQSTIKNCVC